MVCNCPTNTINSALYERATHRIATCLTFTSRKEHHHQFIGCDEYPEVYDCIAGICCPTRGMTCIQPLNTGDKEREGEGEKERENRWWYNSASGQCLAFKYSGKGGNSNNFLSQMQCEAYCKGRCARGDPIDVTNSNENENYLCKIHDTDRMLCCPTPAFLCSSLGGVNVEKTTLKPYSPGSLRRGASSIQRWYWDTTDLNCKPFKYNGQGGNFNNFEDRKECATFCSSRLCLHGSPLRDPSENVQRCSATSLCPDTHECRHTVCCPKPATTCLQPLKSLDCEPAETVTRWMYSTEHGMCKSVLSSRCLQGDNQFDSLEECQTVCSSVQVQPKCPIGKAYKSLDGVVLRCSSLKPCPSSYECVYTGSVHACCPSREYTCNQMFSPGTTCGPSTHQRWYYDAMQNKCNQFEYQGCNGNDNNFATRMDCVETCQRDECPDGGAALVDSSNGRSIACEKNDDCPSTHTCTRQLYTNRTSCCPSRKWTCSHDASEGVSCGQPSKRFYFDPESETCKQFDYLGCAGNANSFASRVACYQFCQSASCSSSEIVYHPSNLDEPLDCSLKPCPRHFTCVRSVWDETKNVCCGSPNFGVCSSTQHPMVAFSTQQPMTCTPNAQVRGFMKCVCVSTAKSAQNRDAGAQRLVEFWREREHVL
uniref:BPTI/Kunitz inhibitor domain-containing protein n=1 Tax=Caenorhabditis japonica TaxID=281687 RepID=A0A8R1HMM1_CAEJA